MDISTALVLFGEEIRAGLEAIANNAVIVAAMFACASLLRTFLWR